jgi:Lar family restriction alleviation protein
VELKKCPFCGGTNIKVFMKGVDKLKYAALCQECDARSGRKATKKEALDEWNRRANDEGYSRYL